MPIKPENRAKYPTDWQEIRERIRLRSGDRCEWPGSCEQCAATWPSWTAIG